MAGKNKACPKCKGRMGKGLIADHAYIAVRQQEWAEELKFFGWSRKNARYVATYRCEKCGYLENYAP